MRRKWSQPAGLAIGPMPLLVLAFMLVPACGGDGGGGADGTGPPTPSPDGEKVVITIGNLTDKTGPASNAMHIIDMALNDMVRHFNEEGLIPGVELGVISYDEQFDPSRDIPGYEWLRERGADLIFSAVPAAVVTVKPRANQDQVLLFGVSGNLDVLTPPGYVFSVGTIPQHEAFTLLRWIAENDWDYQSKGPAKIGGAAWNEAYFGWWMKAIEDYADAHPEQFEWAGGYLTDFGFTWGPEVQALQDCDYVLPNNPMVSFAREFRGIGAGATFVGASTHLSFLGMVDDANMWDEIDGMLLVCSTRWWNEEGMIIDLTNQLLEEYHPDEADAIRRAGVGYIASAQMYLVIDIIRDAVASAGPENFDSGTLYEAAQSYSLAVDGIERFSFGPAKRYATDYYGIYTASAAERDVIRIDPEWHPAWLEP